MNSYFRVSQWIWLILCLLCGLTTTWFFITNQTDNGYLGVGMTVLAGIMYGLRRRFNSSQQK
jgi:hypothetical protein